MAIEQSALAVQPRVGGLEGILSSYRDVLSRRKDDKAALYINGILIDVNNAELLKQLVDGNTERFLEVIAAYFHLKRPRSAVRNGIEVLEEEICGSGHMQSFFADIKFDKFESFVVRGGKQVILKKLSGMDRNNV